MRRFAISDIHGCARTLEALLDSLALESDDELYFLGDYIDRGPDSRGVLDRLFQLMEEGFQVRCLLGNHEQLLLESLGGMQAAWHVWLQNGGEETLASFGLSPFSHPIDIPGKYLDFFKELEYFIELDDYLLVHAGLDFRLADPLQGTAAMLWIRNWYQDIDKEWLEGRIVVHGHTPLAVPEINFQLQHIREAGVIDIDAGCVFTGLYLNHLCALDLTNQKLYFHKNIDANG